MGSVAGFCPIVPTSSVGFCVPKMIPFSDQNVLNLL